MRSVETEVSNAETEKRSLITKLLILARNHLLMDHSAYRAQGKYQVASRSRIAKLLEGRGLVIGALVIGANRANFSISTKSFIS